MALTVTARGTGTHNTGATTLTPGGRSATLAAGSLGVLCISADNAGSQGATLMAPASATDSKGNVWTRRTNRLYDNGAASAGVEMMFYTAPITVAFLTSDTLTLTWGAGVSPVAKAWTWYEVIPAANSEAVYSTGGDIAGATAANAQVTTGTIAVGDAVIAGYFSENVAAVTGDSDATNGSWGTQQTATIGTTTSGVRIATQSKVQTTTASTQVYDATVNSQDRIAGYIVIHAQHTAQASVTATGGGVAAEVGAGGRTVSAVGTGGGVLVSTSQGAHTKAVVATGGGVLASTAAGGRRGSAAATGGGILAQTATGGRTGSAVATGGGVAAVAPLAGRQVALVATGGGVLTHTYQVASVENHNVSVVATGGGVAAVGIRSARSLAAAATGSGVATVAPVSARRSSPGSVGGGVAAVAQLTARSTSATATAGGGASVSVRSARSLAALLSGGGVLTSTQTTGRRTSVVATGGGSAVVTDSAVEFHDASVTATGGGAAVVSPTAGHNATVAATGGGAVSPSVLAARQVAMLLSGGGVLVASQATGRLGSVVATGGGLATVVAERASGDEHVGSFAATGGGAALIAITTDRTAVLATTGSGFVSLSVLSARQLAVALTGGGVAVVVGNRAAQASGHPLGLGSLPASARLIPRTYAEQAGFPRWPRDREVD